VSEFALRTLLRPGDGDWLAIIVPPSAVTSIAGSLVDEFKFRDQDFFLMSNPESTRALVKDLARNRQKIAIVAGLDRFEANDWRMIDVFRSRLNRSAPVVLVLNRSTAESMASAAPNLFSWAAGAVFEIETIQEQLGDEEREQRLSILRTSTGLSDDEVIHKAKDGTLSPEPEFAEWLVLLGRSDLLEPRPMPFVIRDITFMLVTKASDSPRRL
jgi:hypothetical protein